MDIDVVAPGDLAAFSYNENKKKKGRKKRLTKAERAALKAALEAEEKLRLEMEERERLERERIETEERAARETLERERRDRDWPQLNAIYEAVEAKSAQMQETRDDKRQWSRYMRSDGSPDPILYPQINTFLNINRNPTDKPTFDEFRANVVLILSLIEELELILGEKSTKAMKAENVEELRTTKESLESLLRYKLDAFTHRLLCDAKDDADKETGNTLTSLGGDVFTLNCWANLACNPRLHSQTFTGPTSIVTFEVPRPLTIIPCGVRFLRTDFDHLSPSSPAAELRLKTPGEGEVAVLALEGTVLDGGEVETKRSTTTAGTTLTTATNLAAPVLLPLSPAALAIEVANSDLGLVELPVVEFEDFRFGGDVVDLRAFDLVGGVFHFDLIQMPPQPKDVREWRIREIEDPPIQRLTYEKDIPGLLRPSTATVRSEAHTVTSGEVRLDVNLSRTKLPHGKTKEKRPAIKKRPAHESGRNRDSELSRRTRDQQYPQQQQQNKWLGLEANQNQQLPVAPKKSQGTFLSHASVVTTTSAAVKVNPPFGLTFSLPPDCVTYEAPVVALWDDLDNVWRKSNFEDVDFDQETRTVSLSTYKFGALGCFQDRHINFPMTGWELRPLSNSSALLTVNAAKVDVQIEIAGDKCCLREPSNCSPLAGILGNWVTPKTLVHILRSRGLNIFPYEDSRKHVLGAYKKNWMQEHKEQLWGIFLFPEEYDVPEEVPEPEPEDDFFSFLKKPAVEELESEPEPPKSKKGKRGKSKNRNADVASEDEQKLTLGELRGSDINLHSDSSRNNNARRASVASTISGKKARGGRRKRKEPKPKPPQQILWENFNAWLLQYRLKHPGVVENLHREMALVAHVFAFSGSKWNLDAGVGKTNLILRAAEVTPGENVVEDVWENFLVTWKRVMPLRLKEGDEIFSDELKDGGLVMSNFYHMAKLVGSESLRRRLQQVDVSFVETLREILDATQLFVFA